MAPCIVFEDDHLLVVNKPPGLNTHSSSPYGSEGIYDWLRHREPRWAELSIIHRLDKETSGLIVFSKTALANRPLTEQFTRRTVRKKYLLLTDRPVEKKQLIVKSSLVRVGEKYLNRPLHAGANIAETTFLVAEKASLTSTLVEAMPLTGRTHQIRVHAAQLGFPILGDTLYGGSPAPRLCLHATELHFKHPAGGKEMNFQVPPDFEADPQSALRSAVIDPGLTTAHRLIHGASDGFPGWYVDRLGDYLLSQSEATLGATQNHELQNLMAEWHARGVCHKRLLRQIARAASARSSPQHVLGKAAPDRFTIRENGIQFELSFNEGYSVGLFLDQRDNRRRLLTGHLAANFPLFHQTGAGSTPEVLNTFAYTCGFSACAAKAGAMTTSLDLSKKYLEWGRRNFELNQLALPNHQFIHGDAFDWLRRLAKKQRRFDVVLLDPPTFSQSKEFGAFRVQKDLGTLVRAALPLLKSEGALFVSSNAAGWEPESFLSVVESAVRLGKRKILQSHYVPQPLDFPISRSERAYLKTVWLRVS